MTAVRTSWLGLLLPTVAVLWSGGCSESVDTGSRDLIGDALPRFQRDWSVPFSEPSPLVEKARGLLRNQQPKRAGRVLQNGLDRGEESPAAYFLLGLACFQQSRYAAARGLFERSLEQGPSCAESRAVFLRYGECLAKLGEPDQARAAFEAHLKVGQERGAALRSLAELAIEQGELERAESLLDDALIASEEAHQGAELAIALEAARVHLLRAELFLERDDLESARGALETSIELHPRQAEVYYKLSRVLTRLGEDVAAARAMQQFESWKTRSGR